VSSVGDLEGWSQHDVLADLAKVERPMLVIRGDDDFWVPKELVEESVNKLPSGEAIHLPNVGHYPMFEDPQLVAEITGDFCRRHGVL
jgi:pimeloyl-ACP methyl ester carboxylesterase